MKRIHIDGGPIVVDLSKNDQGQAIVKVTQTEEAKSGRGKPLTLIFSGTEEARAVFAAMGAALSVAGTFEENGLD